MNYILGAAKIPLTTLLALGAFGAVIIIAWSYSNWRAAVKVAFVAVLVEGAVRKWVFPQGQELAYFLKDVFLFGAYLKFFFAPDTDLRAMQLRIPGSIILLLCAIVAFGAMNPNIGSVLLALYGLKIYFMYVPLLFMMPYLFRTREELLRQLIWYVLLAIPICALGFLQYSSDRFSVINTFAAGMLETGATGFGVGDRARITGTFSYISGHTAFVVIFFTLTLVLLSLREARWKWLFIMVLLPMLAGNALMGGSRATVAAMAFVTVGCAIAAMGGRMGTSSHFLKVLVIGCLMVLAGSIYVFSDALMLFGARTASGGDTLRSRSIDHPVAAMERALQEGGAFGFGMGVMHPATQAIRDKMGILPIKQRPTTLDNEMGQVMAELGLIGFLAWYGLRFLLVWLNWSAFMKSPPGITRVLCLASVLITVPFMVMSVVYNHTANFFLFALYGLGLIPMLEPTVQRRFTTRSRVAVPGGKLPAPGRHN